MDPKVRALFAILLFPRVFHDTGKPLPPLPAPAPMVRPHAPHAPPKTRPAVRVSPRAAKEKPAATALEPNAPRPELDVKPTSEESTEHSPETPNAPSTDTPSEAQLEQDALHPGAPSAPGTRYGKMTRAQCMQEAKSRALPIVSVDMARGVLAPVRMTGALHGVTYRSAMRESERKTSVFEIFDCRLVLALDDLASTLQKHDVVEVIHMSAYRPPAAKFWKDGQIGTRHAGALALDVGTFVKKDGTTLNVERDYHGYIGLRACPSNAPSNELRTLACETISRDLFHVFLTPGFNWAHRNHFHMEVSGAGTHFYVR
jgi:hypothetical protein